MDEKAAGNWWYWLVLVGLLALAVAVTMIALLWFDDAWWEDIKTTLTGLEEYDAGLSPRPRP